MIIPLIVPQKQKLGNKTRSATPFAIPPFVRMEEWQNQKNLTGI
jgi:hypothetical protein